MRNFKQNEHSSQISLPKRHEKWSVPYSGEFLIKVLFKNDWNFNVNDSVKCNRPIHTMTSYSKYFQIVTDNTTCADFVHCGYSCWQMLCWNAVNHGYGCCKYIGPISVVIFKETEIQCNNWNSFFSKSVFHHFRYQFYWNFAKWMSIS